MDPHSGKPDPKEERSLKDQSTEEILERLRNANVPSQDPKKLSLAEYLNEQEEIESEDRSDPSRSDIAEDQG